MTRYPLYGKSVRVRKISTPLGLFFILSLCSLSVLLCPDCPGFAFCPYSITKTSMPPAGFELAIPASDHPQTLALGWSATGIGSIRSPARSESLYRLRYLSPPYDTDGYKKPEYVDTKILRRLQRSVVQQGKWRKVQEVEKIFERIQEGRQRIGRSRMRWLKDVEKDLQPTKEKNSNRRQ